MKKIFSILLAGILALSLFAACGGAPATAASGSAESEALSAINGNAASETTTAVKEVKVGLIQLVEHTSLDEIRAAIEAELADKAASYRLAVSVNYQNAQNDMSMINSICRQFVDDGVDAIIAIATPAAQGAASATSDIPVVFSAVTDPVSAGLVQNLQAPEGNITGTSDAIDVAKIFGLATEMTPGIETFGFLYNKGEPNSVSVIAQAKEYLESQGIKTIEKTVTTAGEAQQAARVLFESCDAGFSPIDNTVASAMRVVADEAVAAQKPMYVAADSMVQDGGLATVGVNYTTLGKQTADMALRVLSGVPVAEVPVEVLTETTTVVNEETAGALDVDVAKYLG